MGLSGFAHETIFVVICVQVDLLLLEERWQLNLWSLKWSVLLSGFKVPYSFKFFIFFCHFIISYCYYYYYYYSYDLSKQWLTIQSYPSSPLPPPATASDRHEARRHASVLILRDMAHNAPTLFYPYVSQFFENIWVALRDAKVVIREGAADALRACLELISQRESQQRPQWYQNIYDEANKSKLLFSLLLFLFETRELKVCFSFRLEVGNSWVDSWGAVGHQGASFSQRNGWLFFFFSFFFFPTYFLFSTCVKWQFLGNRYAEICEIVLKLREHKDALVRRSVIGLIPLLAQFDPTLFASNHLATCMNYLLSQLKKDKERPPGLLLFDLLI